MTRPRTITAAPVRALRCSWALSLLGLSCLTAGGSRRAGYFLTSVRDLAAEGWGPIWRAGEVVQEVWGGRCFDAREAGGTASALRELATAASLMKPTPSGRLCRREMVRRVRIYRWVRKAMAGPSDLAPQTLRQRLQAAGATGRGSSLWRIEGLGYAWAKAQLGSDRPEALWRRPAYDSLPVSAWPMLHAGLGLAAAEHCLAQLLCNEPVPVLRRSVAYFHQLCRRHARPRHLDAAVESLGLVARCFYPELCRRLGASGVGLRQRGIWPHYWHGVGRALYFVPESFVPGHTGLPAAARRLAREVPPDARREAAAGLGYVFALVNLGDPELLEAHLGTDVTPRTAFFDGWRAAIAMRVRVLPEGRDLERLAAHRPRRRVGMWRRHLAEPLRQARAGGPPAGPETGGAYAFLASREAEPRGWK